MKYFYSLRTIYCQYFLLAATASIIIVAFLASINVLLITMHPVSFFGMLGLLFSTMGMMRFLAFFLAQYPKNRIFESFITGIILQLIVLLVLVLN
ncbi:hypothetical protein OAP99_00175 [Flavobacteriaceae bacterium]|nr:hypothetical protein [Flavobacteriaceae bacterium]MDC1060587.1 hypothetical protein [Flavobacteriaceae bacterium]